MNDLNVHLLNQEKTKSLLSVLYQRSSMHLLGPRGGAVRQHTVHTHTRQMGLKHLVSLGIDRETSWSRGGAAKYNLLAQGVLCVHERLSHGCRSPELRVEKRLRERGGRRGGGGGGGPEETRGTRSVSVVAPGSSASSHREHNAAGCRTDSSRFPLL